MIKYYTLLIMRFFTKFFCIFPMKKNKILFYSFSGKECSDSPRYIAEFLNENYPDEFQIVWAVNDIDRWKELEIFGWKVIKYKSFSHIIESITSKFIITNTGPFKAVTNRKGQEIINTWHGGGAYKKTGMDNPYKDKYRILYNKQLGQAGVTLFVSSSKIFTKYAIKGAFDYRGQVMESGLPRNDLLIQISETEKMKINQRVKVALGLDCNEHLVLYAPTWKNYDTDDYEKLNAKKIILALEHQFGGKWRFAFRGHNLSNGLQGNTLSTQCINATYYKNMQELLSVADVLISDYSSCIWDFSLTRKPCFLFTPDLNLYDKIYAFYTPIGTWGFPVCKSNKKLIEEIINFNQITYEEAIKKNHIFFECTETGTARKKVCDFITGRLY